MMTFFIFPACSAFHQRLLLSHSDLQPCKHGISAKATEFTCSFSLGIGTHTHVYVYIFRMALSGVAFSLQLPEASGDEGEFCNGEQKTLVSLVNDLKGRLRTIHWELIKQWATAYF